MKKALVLTLALILAVFSVFTLASCDVEFNLEDIFGSTNVEISFIVDGTVYDTVSVAKGGQQIITLPENPTKEGYTFDGWYWDEGSWEKPFTANSLLDAPIQQSISVYAKWSPVTVQSPDDSTQGDGDTTPDDNTQGGGNTTPDEGTQGDGGADDGGTSTPDVHTHTLTHHAKVEASCTANGNIEYWSCVDCGKKYSDEDGENLITAVVIGRTAHSLTHHARVEAGCTTDGNIEYWYCSGCEKNYSDENGANEVGTVAIPAGHVAASSSSGCTRCGAVSFEGLVFKLKSDNTYEVSDYSGSAASVVIPATYENALVTSIGSYAFEGCNSLTSITIPNSVTSIGEDAFFGCSSLTSITIPSSVTSIDSYAFRNCTSLEYNTYDNAYYLGNDENLYLFLVEAKDTSITACTINSNTRFIFSAAFYNCTSLTSITIPSSVTSIGEGAFYKCTALTEINFNATAMNDLSSYNFVFYKAGRNGSGIKVTIGKNVTKIPAYLFCVGRYSSSDSPKITSVEFEEGSVCTSIEKSAFNGCSSLASITIPNGVTSIGDYAFVECDSLTSITIPNSVTSIGEGAFDGCRLLNFNTYDNAYYLGNTDNPYLVLVKAKDTSITSCTINSNTRFIRSHAFDGCTSLTSITVDSANTAYKSVDGNLYTKDGSTLIQYAIGKSDTSFTIPNSVTTIGSSAFSDCSSLASITIPNSVTSIGDGAFASCSSLTSVTIGSSVTTIGSYAFGYCTSLTSITIPNSVTSIGEGAFIGCSALTSVTIGSGVTTIGNYAFNGCYKLVEVYNLSSLNITKGSSSNGYVGCYALDIYTSATDASKLHTTSDGYIFYEDGNIVYLVGYTANSTTIILPDEYNGKNYAINKYAFSGCTSLTSVTIGSGVTSIGNNAFNGCTALTEINFNATAMNDLSYYNYVFSYAGQSGSGIKVTIGKNVTKIPAYLFCPVPYSSSYAPKITSVEFEEGSVCTSIGDYAFYRCSSLDKVYISDIAKWCAISFGNSTANPLYYANKLYMVGSDTPVTNLVIPDGVTSIGDYAFEYCNSFASITIPSSVTSIGEYAFEGCTSLTEINFNATAMNDLSSNNYVFYKAGQKGSGIKVTIGKNVTKIPAYLFYPYSYSSSYAPKITSVEFEEGSVCTSIGSYAFGYCTSLTSITIPNSVTSIGASAFYGCTSLESITIASSVTSIGSYAFYNCYKLVEVYNLSGLNITEGSTSYGYAGYNALNVYTPSEGTSKLHTTSDGYIFYEDGDTVYLLGCTGNSTTLTLPDKYNGKSYAIYQYAFYENYKITNVTIPNGVTSIRGYAFEGCNSLDKVYISDIAKWCSIDFGNWSANPLYYAKKLYMVGNDTPITNLVIPEGVTSIGNYAFYNCTSLASITIPNSVTSIGADALSECSSLESITVDSANTVYKSVDGNLYTKDGSTLIRYSVGKTDTSFAIPTSVAHIGYKAFQQCSSLTSITIPSGVTSIGEDAFNGCTSLTSITIPNSVTSIGDYAFSGCTSLTSITFAEGSKLTSIGLWAFNSCTSLTSITIPSSVTSIGEGAFSNCNSLTSITIPSSVTSIGSYAFSGCSSLTSVTFENKDGWWISTSSSATSGTSISSTDLESASTAATYLKSTYYYYYWKRG